VAHVHKCTARSFLGWPHERLCWVNNSKKSQVSVTHACNPSYLGGWDWENYGSRPAWGKKVCEIPSQW
jgi:hypothetical protein